MVSREQFRAEPRKPVVQSLRIVRRQNRRAALRNNRPGVQAGVHFHDGDAGFGLAVGNGPLDRRGAAIFRQQRSVDVQAAVRGKSKIAGGKICP